MALGKTSSFSLQPYPSYRDSGVEWLGKVPEHWEIRRLKNWVGINRRVLPEDTDPEYGIDYVDIGSVATGKLTEAPRMLRFGNAPSRARRVVAEGDTLVSLVRPYLKAVWHAEGLKSHLVASTGFAVLTPNRNTAPKFVSYLCQSDPFTNQISSQSVGVAYPAIAETRFGTIAVCIPPFSEQSAVARYLDTADQRIQRYIKSKERLAELLDEYKQALIQQAVTGRIDVRTGQPYPSYRDSGVEWLGKVPEHWEIQRLRAFVDNVIDHVIPRQAHGLRVGLEHVESWTGRVLPANTDLRFHSQVKRFAAGDVLFGKLRPYLAKVAHPDVAGVCVNEFLVLRPTSNGSLTISSFLAKLLRSKRVIDTIDASTVGAKMPRAEWKTVGILKAPIPPLPEQQAIARYLDDAERRISAQRGLVEREIALIREYRTRLIADVVTGKLDVRQAAAALPDSETPPTQELSENGPDHIAHAPAAA